MMHKSSGGGGGNEKSCFPAAWESLEKVCDNCNSAAALVFCRTDSAFMCISCDSKFHGDNKLLELSCERVWLCEVCKQAPANVTCNADAASLCFNCDYIIHSANQLSRRHERSPVVPFYVTAELMIKSPASTTTFLFPPPPPPSISGCHNYVTDDDQWISSSLDHHHTASGVTAYNFDSDNHYFDDTISSNTGFQHHDYTIPPTQLPPLCYHSAGKHFEIDFTKSQISSYDSNNPQSLSHIVASSSSMEVGMENCLSEISSYSYGRSSSAMEKNGSTTTTTGGGGGGGGGNQMVMEMNREASVLRYREKRKNRKFEKTIRYASRKAYAETRPRIKGRFTKRKEQIVDSTIDIETTIFSPTIVTSSASSALFSDSIFGV